MKGDLLPSLLRLNGKFAFNFSGRPITDHEVYAGGSRPAAGVHPIPGRIPLSVGSHGCNPFTRDIIDSQLSTRGQMAKPDCNL
jgi:hypothetical protein